MKFQPVLMSEPSMRQISHAVALERPQPSRAQEPENALEQALLQRRKTSAGEAPRALQRMLKHELATQAQKALERAYTALSRASTFSRSRPSPATSLRDPDSGAPIPRHDGPNVIRRHWSRISSGPALPGTLPPGVAEGYPDVPDIVWGARRGPCESQRQSVSGRCARSVLLNA